MVMLCYYRPHNKSKKELVWVFLMNSIKDKMAICSNTFTFDNFSCTLPLDFLWFWIYS